MQSLGPCEVAGEGCDEGLRFIWRRSSLVRGGGLRWGSGPWPGPAASSPGPRVRLFHLRGVTEGSPGPAAPTRGLCRWPVGPHLRPGAHGPSWGGRTIPRDFRRSDAGLPLRVPRWQTPHLRHRGAVVRETALPGSEVGVQAVKVRHLLLDGSSAAAAMGPLGRPHGRITLAAGDTRVQTGGTGRAVRCAGPRPRRGAAEAPCCRPRGGRPERVNGAVQPRVFPKCGRYVAARCRGWAGHGAAAHLVASQPFAPASGTWAPTSPPGRSCRF